MMTPVSRATALPAVPAESAEPASGGRRFRVAPVEARAEQPPAAALPAGPLSAERPTIESGAARVVARLIEAERAVDRGLAKALRGGTMSPQELLALQVNVIRYSQELEVISRIVEKVTGAVKQTLQTQV